MSLGCWAQRRVQALTRQFLRKCRYGTILDDPLSMGSSADFFILGCLQFVPAEAALCPNLVRAPTGLDARLA